MWRWRRLRRSVALFLLASGCDGATGVALPLGDYALSTVDGAPLPYQYQLGSGPEAWRLVIVADTIQLFRDGRTQRFQYFLRLISRGQEASDSLVAISSTPGRFDRIGGAIVIREFDLFDRPIGPPDTLYVRGQTLVDTLRSSICTPEGCTEPTRLEMIFRRQ